MICHAKENVDFIDIKKVMGESHNSEKQRSDENGTLGLLYNFGCEIHLQQKIYLPNGEMYIYVVSQNRKKHCRKRKIERKM